MHIERSKVPPLRSKIYLLNILSFFWQKHPKYLRISFVVLNVKLNIFEFRENRQFENIITGYG